MGLLKRAKPREGRGAYSALMDVRVKKLYIYIFQRIALSMVITIVKNPNP